MHYLITGHTGFKGSWLTLVLREGGHTVSGIALDPIPGSLFDQAALQEQFASDQRIDIRHPEAVQEAVGRIQPDVVIHLAAQPLVRESYRDPRGTLGTNVWGTLNVLEAVRSTPSVKGCLVVTTDKVYRNDGRIEGYVESDPLGGLDPYSASKAMADLATQSLRASFDGPPIAIARAGNVIGGGDTAEDRLLPDLLTAFAAGTPARIRNPRAIRPWQHTLDCLSGYLLLVDAMLADGLEGEWNFGPDPSGFRTVAEVADAAAAQWGVSASWEADDREYPHESAVLTLNAAKSRDRLGWRDRLELDSALAWTIDWAKAVASGADALEVSRDQVREYLAR